MPEDLKINSFDDLKAALNEALHNGGTSPDAADYLMERVDVLCVDIDNVFLSLSANDIQEYYPSLSSMRHAMSVTTPTKTFGTRADTVTSMTRRGVKSRPR